MSKDLFNQIIKEQVNVSDKVILDVPLFIRLLEYAKEDAKTDIDLHNLAEKAIKLSSEYSKVLTMDDYGLLISKSKVEAKLDTNK